MPLGEWISGRMFQFMHQHNLVYNTCWEDPRLDRVALELQPHDTLLVITSAGCNALDYALAGPERVIAVDLNPRQNALLELKLAGIRHLRYEDFFAMFGRGRLDQAGKIYGQKLRPALSPWRKPTGTAGSSSSSRPAPSVLFPRHLPRPLTASSK